MNEEEIEPLKHFNPKFIKKIKKFCFDMFDADEGILGPYYPDEQIGVKIYDKEKKKLERLCKRYDYEYEWDKRYEYDKECDYYVFYISNGYYKEPQQLIHIDQKHYDETGEINWETDIVNSKEEEADVLIKTFGVGKKK